MLRQALQQGSNPRGTVGLLGRDGQRRSVIWGGRAVFRADLLASVVLLVGHDITELEEAQAQALQAERLAALGQVMASLAHESRNLLQRAQSCLERLSWRLEGQPEALDLLDSVISQEGYKGRRGEEEHDEIIHLLDKYDAEGL